MINLETNPDYGQTPHNTVYLLSCPANHPTELTALALWNNPVEAWFHLKLATEAEVDKEDDTHNTPALRKHQQQYHSF